VHEDAFDVLGGAVKEVVNAPESSAEGIGDAGSTLVREPIRFAEDERELGICELAGYF